MSKPADSKLNKHGKRGKLPLRILHFSDGTLEEYSTDEEDDIPDSKADNQITHVDPVKYDDVLSKPFFLFCQSGSFFFIEE